MESPGTRDYEAEVLALMKVMQSAGKAIVLHEAKKALADYPARQATIFEFPRQDINQSRRKLTDDMK